MPPTSPPAAGPLRRRWLPLAAVAVLLLALAARALPPLAARSLPTGKAEWIWEARGSRQLTPGLFYAARDFALTEVPGSARLAVGADPEYVLYLNGRRLGQGGYDREGWLDVYEVAPLLAPGGNRVVALLRSDRGAGGFLLSLTGDSGAPIVWSDSRFRVFRRHDLGLLRGWQPLDGSAAAVQGAERGEPARSWGLPPIGRWGRPQLGRVRPLAEPAAALVPAAVTTTAPLHLLVDWGREVTGRLELDLWPLPPPPGGDASAPPVSAEAVEALLYVGDAPPDPRRERPAGAILVPPYGHEWLDARPRRGRYMLLVGLPAVPSLRLLPAPDSELPRELARTVSYGKGVLGIVPPPLRTPVEDEVGRKLERVAGVAGRKEL